MKFMFPNFYFLIFCFINYNERKKKKHTQIEIENQCSIEFVPPELKCGG